MYCATVGNLERTECLGTVGNYAAGYIIFRLLPYFVHAYTHWMQFKLTRLPHPLSLQDFQIITLQIVRTIVQKTLASQYNTGVRNEAKLETSCHREQDEQLVIISEVRVLFRELVIKSRDALYYSHPKHPPR
jgi:hypothetical protein